LILSILLFSILACSISQSVTPTYTVTPSKIPPTGFVGIGTPTKEPSDIILSCVVSTQALNVRECSSESCKNINRWLIQGDTINITKISSDGQWYFWKNGGGWIKAEFCNEKK
jgi:hypothetical protein